MKTMMAAIAVNNLSFGYVPDAPCFMNNISLAIPKGSVCAVLGPNGSGKTTLLHLFLGLLSPVSGKVDLRGNAKTENSHNRLKRIVGLVPQEESVPFNLSVLEYVLLGRAPHLGLFDQPGKNDRLIAKQALQKVGIAHLKYRSIPSLSGGERQLAMVARVLVQESAILLMDEPTSHLDLANTKKVLDLMRMLKNTGKTVVFTSHDPNAASAVADHVVLIKDGEILSEGDCCTVLCRENLEITYGIDLDIVRSKGKTWVVMN